jgi:hypothetical protein
MDKDSKRSVREFQSWTPIARTKMASSVLLTLTLSVCLGAIPALATETTGTILGTIRDASGAVIPGAAVIVKNRGTQETRSARTDHEGAFVLPLLVPGAYDVSVEAPGFNKYVDSDVSVSIGQKLRIEVALVLGTVQATINVIGVASQVDTSSTELGKTETSDRVANLPLIGRNLLQLAVLQPGVTTPIEISSPETPNNLPGGILLSPNVNGMRNNANNYLLDGSDNNEPVLGVAAVVPSVDSVEEFKIITGLYSAEYGRSGGSVVNIITKSGTNHFHGSASDFLRNDAFNARNFFAQTVSPFKRNQFEVTFGGPIVANKTFFFLSYEGIRQRQGQTTQTTVPSSAERQGDFSALNPAPVACTDAGAICDPLTGLPFPGNKIPVSSFDPAAKLVENLWPLATNGGSLFVSQPVLPSDANQFSTKIDQVLTSVDRFSARYFFDQGTSIVLFQPSFLGPVDVPGFPAKDFFRLQNLVLQETHTFSQNTLNEFRASYNRAHLIASQNLSNRIPSDFGFKFEPNLAKLFPDIGVTGFSTVGTSDFDNVFRFNNIYDYQDNVAIVRGRHSMKTGFEYLRSRLSNDINQSQPFFLFSPTFTGNSFGDFLLGDSSLLITGGGNTRRDYTSNKYNAYFQDNFRVSRKITLNLGLRYELKQPFLEEHRLISVFIPGAHSIVRPNFPPGILFAGDPGVPERGTFTKKKDFAPRIGIAWDPFGDGKNSIRAGYGLYYDAGDFNAERLANFVSPGIYDFLVFFGAKLSDPYPAFGFTSRGPWAPENINATLSNPPPGSQVNSTNPNFGTAYVHQYGLSIQRELAPNYVFEVGYVGNTSRKLAGTIDLNQPILTPTATSFDEQTRRPFQPWGIINWQFGGFNSYYNGLQLTFDKRLSRGFSFRGAYTWSHTIDFGSIPQTFQKAVGQPVFPQNGRNLAAEKGNAAFDVRHRFVLSYYWDLPAPRNITGPAQKLLGNWAVAGITTFQTGIPITVVDSSDPSLTGEFADRPNVTCNPNWDRHTINEWFNTGCFQQVGPFGGLNHDGFGNARRNIVRAPGLNVFNFSIIKRIPFRERVNLQFRTEIFNLLNHPNFAPPGSDVSAFQTFGKVLKTRRDDERQIQFALKLEF